MNLTVTGRIVGGYAVMLALAIGILITGLIAITRINVGLESVTDRAAPMTRLSAELQTALLRTHANVLRHGQRFKTEELTGIETDTTEQRQRGQKAASELDQITEPYPELRAQLHAVSAALTPIFDAADAAFAARRKEL